MIQQVVKDISNKLVFSCFILIFVHSLDNVYIADYYNYCVRKVTVSTGIITTIAGTGSNDYTGDGGAATSAKLKYPYGVAVDASGRTYKFSIKWLS